MAGSRTFGGTRGRVVALTAAGLLLGLATVAAAAPRDNGIGTKPPDAVLAAAIAAGEHARSVHVVGSLVTGGTHFGIDCRFVGNEVAGRLVQNGLPLSLIVTGAKVYVKAGPKFWRAAGGASPDPTVVKLLANRWVASKAKGGAFAQLATEFRLRGLMQSLAGSHGKLAVGASTRIHGHPAVALKDTTEGGTIYVATTGPPFPLSIQEAPRAGHDSGTLNFEGWNTPMKVAPPPAYLDLDKLHKP